MLGVLEKRGSMGKLENLDLPRQRGRRFGQLNLKWIAATVLVLLVAGGVSVQLAMLWTHPVTHGAASWAPISLGECREFEPTATMLGCSAATFAPGDPVGMGFSVRNTGPLPLTVVSVASFELVLVEMHPILPPEGEMFAIEGMRPFEPITLGPGEEATIQLMGRIRDCDAVRDYWRPGGAMRFEAVRLTVRWLLMSTEVEIPLQQALQIDGPAEGQCH